MFPLHNISFKRNLYRTQFGRIVFLLAMATAPISFVVAAPIERNTLENRADCATREQRMAPSKPLAIVLDLGGVLCNTSKSVWGIPLNMHKMGVALSIGLAPMLRYALYSLVCLKNPLNFKLEFYALLRAVDSTSVNQHGVTDGVTLLPGLMCDWLAGKKSGLCIKRLINDYLKVNPGKLSKVECILMCRLAHLIFDPNEFARRCVLSDFVVDQIKQYKKQGYRVCILSNWDADSFNILRKKWKDLFELFAEQDLFISGRLGMVKPDQAVFKHLLCHIKMPCLFIDDQLENVQAACLAGMKAVHFQQGVDHRSLGMVLRDSIKEAEKMHCAG